jgi:nucleoside-diphosphate-sugar epimerase
VNEVLRIVGELTGVSPDPVFEPPREGDVRRTEADVSLARELLGYDPAVDMRRGLQRTVEHLRATLEQGSG